METEKKKKMEESKKKLMKKAIKCIDWEAKVTHKANGQITYP